MAVGTKGATAVNVDVAAVVSARVAAAAALRVDLGLTGAADTDVYRLVNSEGRARPILLATSWDGL